MASGPGAGCQKFSEVMKREVSTIISVLHAYMRNPKTKVQGVGAKDLAFLGPNGADPPSRNLDFWGQMVSYGAVVPVVAVGPSREHRC